MAKSRLGTLALLVIGAVLVLSSCGGGGSKRLTKEQFAAKADALCAAFHKKVNAVPTPTTADETVAYLEKLLPLDEKLIADIKNLKPPANEEATVKRVGALGEEQSITRVKNLIAALKANDQAKVKTLIAEGDKNANEMKALFEQLGITECQKT